MKKLTLLTGFVCCLLMYSCDKGYETTENSNKNTEVSEGIKTQILSLGFDTTGVVLLSNNEYLVEGDIILTDEHLESIQTKQAATPYGKISSYCNVTVGFASSFPTSTVGNQWKEAFREAVGVWNFVGKCELRLTLSDTNPDILIMPADNTFPQNAIAAANPPMNGKAGSRVYVNFNFQTTNLSQKIHNAVHELGHAIGLAHTNWWEIGDQGIQINGTPTSDPNSVMNGGTALNSWRGLSTYDEMALQYLYPRILYFYDLIVPDYTQEDIGKNVKVYAKTLDSDVAYYEWETLPDKATIIRGQGTNELTIRLESLPLAIAVTMYNTNGKYITSVEYYDGDTTTKTKCKNLQ